MCGGGAPKPGKPIPAAQPARAPDAGSIYARSSDRQRRRFGFAATILTPTGGLGPATTTGKSLLGQ